MNITVRTELGSMKSFNDMMVREEIDLCKKQLHLSSSQKIRVLGVSDEMLFVQSADGEGIAVLLVKGTQNFTIVQPKDIYKVFDKYEFYFGFGY